MKRTVTKRALGKDGLAGSKPNTNKPTQRKNSMSRNSSTKTAELRQRREGQKLQAVDQVHLNKDSKVDQLIIYMRPIPAAQKFAEAISQRLQPAR